MSGERLLQFHLIKHTKGGAMKDTLQKLRNCLIEISGQLRAIKSGTFDIKLLRENIMILDQCGVESQYKAYYPYTNNEKEQASQAMRKINLLLKEALVPLLKGLNQGEDLPKFRSTMFKLDSCEATVDENHVDTALEMIDSLQTLCKSLVGPRDSGENATLPPKP